MSEAIQQVGDHATVSISKVRDNINQILDFSTEKHMPVMAFKNNQPVGTIRSVDEENRNQQELADLREAQYLTTKQLLMQAYNDVQTGEVLSSDAYRKMMLRGQHAD